jgi:hypothetical protein
MVSLLSVKLMIREKLTPESRDKNRQYTTHYNVGSKIMKPGL